MQPFLLASGLRVSCQEGANAMQLHIAAWSAAGWSCYPVRTCRMFITSCSVNKRVTELGVWLLSCTMQGAIPIHVVGTDVPNTGCPAPLGSGLVLTVADPEHRRQSGFCAITRQKQAALCPLVLDHGPKLPSLEHVVITATAAYGVTLISSVSLAQVPLSRAYDRVLKQPSRNHFTIMDAINAVEQNFQGKVGQSGCWPSTI